MLSSINTLSLCALGLPVWYAYNQGRYVLAFLSGGILINYCFQIIPSVYADTTCTIELLAIVAYTDECFRANLGTTCRYILFVFGLFAIQMYVLARIFEYMGIASKFDSVYIITIGLTECFILGITR